MTNPEVHNATLSDSALARIREPFAVAIRGGAVWSYR